ncbi:LOW QUALITY PROTEIN: Hypothetical protein PHPALM_36322 [Phytophthora palmivora]|uniref:Uncharacterized protein n=1 Tax=Phytophthora palmivora TaxID=4796 RepID=A0A2P4X0A3_9STRA|nr:LOW QUALITY PROTEIN: Hypothetical protein PHPALM_36322 [Phytophthora palmivora]
MNAKVALVQDIGQQMIFSEFFQLLNCKRNPSSEQIFCMRLGRCVFGLYPGITPHGEEPTTVFWFLPETREFLERNSVWFKQHTPTGLDVVDKEWFVLNQGTLVGAT